MLPVIISAIESPEDRDLMTEFYNKYNGRMYAEAWKHLSIPEDVEDIVLEAFAKIIDKMETFRTLAPGQRVQYAVTTVRNLSYILTKRKSLYTMVSFETMEYEIEAIDSTDAIVERKMRNEHITEIWRELDVDDRQLLEQKYILKWSDMELAEGLGIKTQSVRMRLTRAKRNVMAQLQKKGFQITDWF